MNHNALNGGDDGKSLHTQGGMEYAGGYPVRVHPFFSPTQENPHVA